MMQPTKLWQACLSGLVVATMCGCTASLAKPEVPVVENPANPGEAANPAKPGEPPQVVVRAVPDDQLTQGTPPPAFRFPDDKGGVLLARLLTPEQQPLPNDPTNTKPRPRKTSGILNEVPPVLPPVVATNPRLPSRAETTKLRPRMMLEETLDGLGEPARSVLAPLPEGVRVRLAADDLKQPVPLPIITVVPLPDRASLADPTTEVSIADAIMGIIPLRMTPAPFQKQVLPDPFEFHHTSSGPVFAPADEEVPTLIRSPRP